MSNKAAFRGIFLLVILAAFLYRLVLLDLRPMHHDEANQAVKFGNLLENGEYRYDRKDHHGPSLYYLSLPFAWIRSGSSFVSVNEVTLRLVPAILGAGIILLLLLLKGGMSRLAIIFAGVFFAISPAMIFYSRFYIQEMLLVFFLLGAIAVGWRYTASPSAGWALAAGFFAGMMYTTKETCIIAFGSISAALLLTWAFQKRIGHLKKSSNWVNIPHLLIGLGAMSLVSWLLYSSFFQNLNGPLDSILAFGTYFIRAGEVSLHTHPWYYYVKMLAFSQYGSGPIWSEALILVLALMGSYAAFRTDPRENTTPVFLRFIFFSTLLSTAVYALISYKTPWNLLPFYMGFILLAGNGAAFILRACKNLLWRGAFVLLLVLSIFHLCVQSYLSNFKYYEDPRNPYVYAQTRNDFLNLIQRIHALASHHPDRHQMLIKVIASPQETWPLPWYLRSYNRVGYWEEVESAGDLAEIPLIISSIDRIEELRPHLQNNYLSEYYGLRPEVLLAIHIKRDLWEKFLQRKAGQ